VRYKFPWFSFEQQLHQIVRLLVFRNRFGKYGKGAFVSPFSEIINTEHVYIGDGVVIRKGAWILAMTSYDGATHQPRLEIGPRTYIGHHVTLSCARSLTIGADVTIGDNVFLADCTHSYRDVARSITRQPLDVGTLAIGNRVWIGKNSVILHDLSIGDNAIIAAGSFVNRSVPSLTMVAGTPARPVKRYDEASKEWIKV
jgi:acetyltransferase-like isoleucine patch superfamily enzyme